MNFTWMKNQTKNLTNMVQTQIERKKKTQNDRQRKNVQSNYLKLLNEFHC